jgi:uncharacterized membrane protein (UPF0127 family)
MKLWSRLLPLPPALAVAPALALAAAVAVAFSGCEPASENTPVSRNEPADFAERFTLRVGGREVRAQVAVTEFETSGGLMWRKALAPDEGMLFVFEKAAQRNFWMRNVPINLALAYIAADGRIAEILAMEAENPTTQESRSTEIRYVLEMPEGWFAANGIATGAQLDLGGVRAALRRRGFSPERYVAPK